MYDLVHTKHCKFNVIPNIFIKIGVFKAFLFYLFPELYKILFSCIIPLGFEFDPRGGRNVVVLAGAC